MEIILVGYMGCGKSTIAKKLADQLDLKMIDLDDYISANEKLSIAEIFIQKGEIYFRKLENKLLKKIIKTEKNYVLAVGGGTPCYANNMEVIKKNVISYYLRASLQTLNKRLSHEKSERPLIKDLEDHQLLEFIAKHLFERRFFYEQASTTINIDNKSIDEIVAEITTNML